ncbi:phage associated protein [Neisseria zoodegmatis]|uniref:Phage associated protein n=1 Tax=Neisseria zoodegmatis TaxID=326523 RepID=A0A378X836_9NEIS|nr:hypothetical protein [Neisseria zoodegmatis]SUA48894.1 phage associated protein [Neisseria zoodegmatis]
MQLNIHENAEKDLDTLFEKNEEGVAFIDHVLLMIDENPALFEGLLRDPYFDHYDDYDPPIGFLGIQAKKILSLWGQGIKVMRLRLTEESVLNIRVIFSTVLQKNQSNGTYIRQINILAVTDKQIDGFNYQIDHPLMLRIINDYEELNSTI